MPDAVEKQRAPSLLLFLVFVVFLFISTFAYSQSVECENNCNAPECNFPVNVEKGCRCFDGIDNDPIAGQPGRFDKADPNCAAYYGLTFVGEGSQCDINVPAVGSHFDMVGPPAVSGQNTADTQSKIAVGDIDADGIPDVVITSKWNSEIRVVATTNGQADGSDAGDIKSDYNLDGSKIFSGSGDCDPKKLLFEHEVLIANIDPNNADPVRASQSEIFGIVSNRQGSPKSPPTCFYLVAFRYANKTLIPLYNAVSLGPNRPGTFGIADMDGDGKAEIYMRDRIYAAETGALLATGNGNWDLDITSGPVAVNVSGDNKMELVCGTKIFGIPSLTNRNPATPATLPLLHDMNAITTNKAFVKMMLDPVEYGEDTHSMCSVADIDNDGKVDVIISGALNSTSGKTAVFYWDVDEEKVTHYVVPDPAYPNGWPWGTSRVNLGDVNGDGFVELSFIAGTQLFCLKVDQATKALSSLWASPRIINDSRSGVLTVTLYDFDNNGKAEMVYRDSQELVIIDGETGTQKIWSATCQSHTYTEGPVIADANGDGATDICVACNRNNSFDINDGIQQQALGEVRMFYSSGNEWLPTRKVWNQPGYFVVNINDDLTLPFPQFDGATVFTGNCFPGQGTVRPFNVFLNQVPFMTSDGCPFFPQPDLTFYGDDPTSGADTNGDGEVKPFMKVDPPFCGSRTVKVTFNLGNEGYLPIAASVPVAFYNGDPLNDPASTLLYTTNISVNLAVGDTTSAVVTFNGPGPEFTLFVVLNNDGDKTKIVPTATDCRLANNIQSILVTPKLFTVSAVKVQDNITCSPTDMIGEAKVNTISNGATLITDWSKYSFQWYDGPAAGPMTIKPGEVNYNLENLVAGTYSVIVTNKDVPFPYCSSEPQEVIIGETSLLPSFTLEPVRQTSCSPFNGSIISDFGGKPTTGYTLIWTNLSNEVVGEGVTTLNGIKSGRYFLTATNGSCSFSADAFVFGPDLPEGEAIVVHPVQNCVDPSSGKITARPYAYGSIPPVYIPDADTSKYSYAWYHYDNATSTQGSMLAPGPALKVPTRDVETGTYNVVITDNTTKCSSTNLMKVDVGDVLVIPTAGIDVMSNQTSCDPNNPNGALQGVALENGVPAADQSKYHFFWYEGQNTLVKLTDGSGNIIDRPILNGVKGGGQMYTLQVVSKDQLCEATFASAVPDLPQIPVVTLDPANNTNCLPLAPNGSVTARIFMNGVETVNYAAFTFNWDAGSTLTGVNPTPNSTNHVLNTQPAGYYTLQVTDNVSACRSIPVNIEVLNDQNIPDATMAAIPSTNCAVPANNITPNGNARVTLVDGSPVPNDGTFSFQWFTGLDETSPVSPAQTNAVLANVQGPATYSIKITNTVNGCTSLTPVQVADNSIVPVVTLTPADNDICDQSLTIPLVNFRGSVTATITNQGTNPISEYTFDWFNKEFGTNTSAGAWTKLDSGTYTLSVTHAPTGCRSSLVSAQVQNLTTTPFIEAEAIASTNCAPTVSGNGSVRVNKVNSLAISAGSPFRFQWFEGQTTSGTLISSSFTSPDNLQGGANNYFTIEVIDNSNGCRNTQTVLLQDNSSLPVITLGQDANLRCEDFDGAASILTVTYKGNDISNASTLSYKWYDGIGAVPGNIRTETSNILNGLASNAFVSATVTMTDLGCTSDFKSVEIENGIVLPTLTPSAIGSQNCTDVTPAGAADGSASVVAAPVDTYNYKWYAGNVVGTPGSEINPASASSINGLQGGSNAYFTVLVKSQTTLCSSNATVFVPDNSQRPVLGPLATTNNTNCETFPDGSPNAPSGKVTLSTLNYQGVPVGSPYDGFTFIWSGTEAPAAGANIPELSDKPSGAYSLTIQHNISKCVSDPVPATILDVLTYPVINNLMAAQTSCDLDDPNGSITSTVSGGTAGFGFDWFNGAGIGGTTLPETSDGLINGLPSGDYTVRVHNLITACASTETIFLPNQITYPELSWTGVSPLTRCDVPNGSATPAVVNASATFTIFKAITAENGIYPVDPNVLIATGTQQTDLSATTNLMPGFVTGVVRNEVTKCISSPVTVEIQNAINEVQYQITGYSSASNCNPGAPGWVGGGIDITISGGAGPAFEYRWYNATPVNTNPDINFYNNPPDMGGASIVNTDITNPNLGRANGTPPDNNPGFTGGVYTLVVTDLGNGCGTYAIDNIPLSTSPEITVTSLPNTKCDGPDGMIQAELTTIAPGPYEFNLYSGNSSAGTLVGTASGADPSLIVNDLPDGNYFVQLVDNTIEGGVLINAACPIGEKAVVVRRAFNPIVSLTLKEANTSCDPSNSADGEVEVSVIPHSQNPVGNTFEIFEVTPSLTGFSQVDNIAGNAVTILTGFGPDSYIVRVRDEMSLCTGEASISIPDQPMVSQSLTVNTTPDTYCFPLSNGEISITAVAPGAVNEYDYQWSADPDLTNVLFGPDASSVFNSTLPGWKTGTITGQGNGNHTYYVRGIKRTGQGVGCPTPIVMAVVSDAHVTPQITLTSTPDTSCDGPGEGTVTALTSTASADPAVANAFYTYLFNGISTTNSNGSVAVVYSTLPNGSYPLIATNEQSQCAAERSVTIENFTFPLRVVNHNVKDQMICDNDGEIFVSNIEFNTGAVQPYNAADYTFQWFRASSALPGSFDPNTPLTDVATTPITSDLLTLGGNAGQYPDMAAGTYYVIATRLSTALAGAGCSTPPYRVDITDRHESPTLALTPFADTSCDGSGEGSIQVLISDDIDPARLNVSPPPFLYEYTWTQSIPVPSPNENNGNADGNDGDGDNPRGLVSGIYGLTVRNLFTNCTTSGATTIKLNETPVFIADVDSLNQTFCAPVNGAITVTRVDAQYPSGIRNTEPLDNFEFSWTDSDGITNVTTDVSLPDLAAGIYFVVAKRTSSTNNGPGVGCVSAPRRVEVLDRTFVPTVTLTPFSDTGCTDDVQFFEGRIQIDAVDNPLSAGVRGPYNYFWEAADPTNNSIVVGTTTNGNGIENMQTGLRDDQYTITVTNTVTQCQVRPATTITKSTVPVIILSASAVPKLTCNPDGSAQVDQVTVGGNGDSNFNNFDFTWYEGSFSDNNAVLSGQNEFLIDETRYADFTRNSLTYFVKAVRKTNAVNADLSPAAGRGCESLPVSVTVPDQSVDPVLTFDVLSNSHCNPALSNASVTAFAEERDGTQDTYEFNWVLGGTTLPLTSNALIPANDGVYTVTAINQVTGCFIANTVEVIRDLTMSHPNIVDVRGVDATDCFATGEAQVFFVTIGGATTLPGTDARFTYEWFTSDPADPGAQPIANSFTERLDDILPGRYFVRLHDNSSECQSAPTQVDVNKCLDCFVDVDILQTMKQINCKTPMNDFAGELTAIALNHNNVNSTDNPGDFVFTWYNALDTAGTIYNNANLSVLSNLQQGDYAVRVVDLVTNCRGKEYYIIQDDANIYKPEILLSAVARQNCETPDGGILVQQVADIPYGTPDYPFLPNYTVTIQEDGVGGSDVVSSTDPINANPLSWYAKPLDVINNYTILLIDNNTQCETTQSMTIPANYVYPDVFIGVENPLEACDDDLANGQLTASADGGLVSAYSFQWFPGEWSGSNEPAPATAFASPTAQNNKLIGVGRGDSPNLFFTVKATNDATGCYAYATAQLMETLAYPISVKAELIQHDTHCIEDEGWVRGAVIDDNGTSQISGYNFYWLSSRPSDLGPAGLENAIAGLSPMMPDHNNLPKGTYFLIAEDIYTGCPAVTEVTVQEFLQIPDLVFKTTPSFCADVPAIALTGKGTGTIEVSLEPTDIVSDDIAWFNADNQNVGSGSYITDLLPGQYLAQVVTTKGCSAEGPAFIDTEIMSYNLVTQNNDGKNDRFVIDCLSFFPNNNVKIFNRSGVLVYEGDYYDNVNTFFDGIGKNGVYMTGNVLPVGTYFYIIDKGDGSKPKTGYLELVR